MMDLKDFARSLSGAGPGFETRPGGGRIEASLAPASQEERALLAAAEMNMEYTIKVLREDDGRWLAVVPELPGAMAYGDSRAEAVANVQALVLHVIADRIEHGEMPAELVRLEFKAA